MLRYSLFKIGFVEKVKYIMPGLICIIYLPLLKDILRWSVKNGTIYVEIGKST